MHMRTVRCTSNTEERTARTAGGVYGAVYRGVYSGVYTCLPPYTAVYRFYRLLHRFYTVSTPFHTVYTASTPFHTVYTVYRFLHRLPLLPLSSFNNINTETVSGA